MLLLIILSILIIFLVRWRRARSKSRWHERWQANPEGFATTDDNIYHEIPDFARTYRGVARTPSTSPRKLRRQPQHRSHIAEAHRSWRRGVSLGLPASRDKDKEKGIRLSWPLQSKKSSKLLGVTEGTRLKRLSPITESPIPRSSSTPELTSAAKAASNSKDAKLAKRRRSNVIDLIADGDERQPLKSNTSAQIAQPRLSLQHDHLRGLRRWKSDSYKLPDVRAYSHSSNCVVNRAPPATRPYTRSRSTSLHYRNPGIKPEGPPPPLPVNAPIGVTRALTVPGLIQERNHAATPASFVSASTSILDCSFSPSKIKQESWAAEIRASTLR